MKVSAAMSTGRWRWGGYSHFGRNVRSPLVLPRRWSALGSGYSSTWSSPSASVMSFALGAFRPQSRRWHAHWSARHDHSSTRRRSASFRAVRSRRRRNAFARRFWWLCDGRRRRIDLWPLTGRTVCFCGNGGTRSRGLGFWLRAGFNSF